MLTSKLLTKKKNFITKVGDKIDDLVSSTFKYADRLAGVSPTLVADEEEMRPDKVANRVYSDSSLWDSLLKFNGVSNPFSISQGEVFFIPPMQALMGCLVAPRIVPEKGEQRDLNANEKKLIRPTTNKDAKMLEALRKKVSEVVPPNVNKTGVKNVITRDGIVVFGANASQAQRSDSNGSLSRSRVIDKLNNSNPL